MLLRDFVFKFDSYVTLRVFNSIGAISGFKPFRDSMGILKVTHVTVVPNADGSQVTLEVWT